VLLEAYPLGLLESESRSRERDSGLRLGFEEEAKIPVPDSNWPATFPGPGASIDLVFV
jgi:hypothetical protein